ncbi:MAG: MATE family efflux transporter [Oscillospiraceae bacterium]|nr:MATE family efflux transporter [Oscillospiraceae bacterium]
MKQEAKTFYKSVFALVLPMALQNLIDTAITSADVIMLGNVSDAALSGSSLAGQVWFVLVLIFFGTSSGACILTAQYWGKKDTVTIERVIGLALRFLLVISALFTVVVALFPDKVMTLFTKETDVIEEGVKYLRIVVWTYIPLTFSTLYLNILRSVEKVKISMVIHFVGFVVNVILNAILIFGLLGFEPMGISGAALATTIARYVQVIIAICYSLRKKAVIHIRLKYIFTKAGILVKDFLNYSLPVIFNELMWSLAVSMNTAIIGHLGKAAVSANSVAQTTRQLAMVVGMGISNATAILLGKAIGEGKMDEAKKNSVRFIRLSLIFGSIGACVVLSVIPIAPYILELSPEALEYLTTMLFIMSYFCIAQGLNTTMVVGIFRSGGDAKIGVVFDLSAMWGITIPCAAVAAFIFHWDVRIVYAILMADELIKIIPIFLRYRTYKWLNNVTRDMG